MHSVGPCELRPKSSRSGKQGNQSKKLLELWLKGPDWLSKPEMWPASVQIGPSKETEAEEKLVKEVVSVAVEHYEIHETLKFPAGHRF